MYAQHLGPESETRGSMTASLVAGAAWNETENASNSIHRDSLGGAVYARNLDWAQQLRDVHGRDMEQGNHLVGENASIGASGTDSSIANFSHGTVTSQNEKGVSTDYSQTLFKAFYVTRYDFIWSPFWVYIWSSLG